MTDMTPEGSSELEGGQVDRRMCDPANEAWSDGLKTENNAGTAKSVGGECPHLDRWDGRILLYLLLGVFRVTCALVSVGR